MNYRDNYESKLIARHHYLESENYWLDKLSGEIRKSCFPYDYDHIESSEKKTGREKVEFKFHRELNSKLIAAGKQSDHTIHIILAAGVVLLLTKYTYSKNSNKDIIIGSPIYRQEIEGEFVNTILPLRIQINDNQSFKDLLQEMKQAFLDGIKNQNYPIELLTKQLDLPDSSISSGQDQDFPLFDAVVLLENIHDKNYFQHINLNTIFSFSRQGESIAGELEYNTRRYERSTIEQIAGHYSALLERALFNARIRLSELEILTDNERLELLETFNRADAGYPGNKTIDECFARQVEKTPDNVAAAVHSLGTGLNILTTADKQYISYRNLNERSDQLARILTGSGITPETIVPVIVDRSIEMVIGILAILKAGAAYLPIEPNYPDERIAYMLTDSKASLLLTTRQIYETGMRERESNGTLLKYRVILIEPESHPQEGSDVTCTGYHPQNLACVIYTSGTSGKPKGVLVNHKGIVNYIYWRHKAYSITGRDITLQLLSYAFDAFAGNFYSSLFSGGVLVMIPGSKKLDFDYARKILKEERVTNMSLVPAMYEALLDRAGSDGLKSLRFVVLGGERARANLLKQGSEKNPHLRHIIEYGPTEASIGAAANLGIAREETSIIGKPIANTKIYIMDHSRQPQPKGVPGELYIAGAGVTRGYLNNPDLTEQKFRVPGSRIKDSTQFITNIIYKTGDLARWRQDGNIEFLGRIDQQVKVSGFRIEPGEIENRLRQHEDIAECIVITRQSNENNQLELMAFYKYKNEKKYENENENENENNTTETLKEMRKFLAAELPGYMIPTHLIPLEEFPLTANGKLDRKALALMKTADILREDNIQPRNEIEKRISEVWKEVIGIENVGINSPFFDIGGTSIKALTVVSELTKELDITIDHIYQYETIAEIAKNVTWKTESLMLRIEEIRKIITQAPPEPREETTVSVKQLDREYKAYLEQVKTENLPSLTAERDYRHILLTGGTGFLGAHLIYEILNATRAELHLLVRGNSPGEAQKRLEEKLFYYFGENFYEKNQHRLHVYQGDIRNEKLEIDDSMYEKLSEMLDAVVHSAADVRHFGMYEDFHSVNVAGTEHLLELAGKGKNKDFHHISTLAVGNGIFPGKKTMTYTEFTHDHGQEINNVYSRSKFEAEKKVLKYREKGMNTSIYRVGNLLSHSETGIFQQNIETDAFYAQMKAFIMMGVVPNIKEWIFDLTFIDATAAAVVKLMTRKNLQKETFHVYNYWHLNWPQMVPLFNEAEVDIKVVETLEFLDYLQEYLESENDNYKEVIARLLLHTGFFRNVNEQGGASTFVKFYHDRTLRILKQMGFQWVKPGRSNIGKMIRHCREVGFLQEMKKGAKS